MKNCKQNDAVYLRHLADIAQDFFLDRPVHIHLLDAQGDEVVEDVGGRLLLHDADLVGRDDGGVDEPHKQERAHQCCLDAETVCKEPENKSLN